MNSRSKQIGGIVGATAFPQLLRDEVVALSPMNFFVGADDFIGFDVTCDNDVGANATSGIQLNFVSAGYQFVVRVKKADIFTPGDCKCFVDGPILPKVLLSYRTHVGLLLQPFPRAVRASVVDYY